MASNGSNGSLASQSDSAFVAPTLPADLPGINRTPPLRDRDHDDADSKVVSYTTA